MLTILLIFFGMYVFLLGTLVLIGYIRQVGKEEEYLNTNESKIDLNSLVVIIPFRNEEHRIERLLKSIQDSAELPKEFIFVDDHSIDKSVALITSSLSGIPHRIIHLSENEQGKKVAIRSAIEASDSDYILSFDADLDFSPSYFSNLKKLSDADMYILPAILKAERTHEHLYEVDLILVNAANCGISGLKRPIMASGANLLYKRSAFKKHDQFQRHLHMPSGDDIYLLRDFRDGGADIRLMSNTAFAIHTETPQSLKEFLHQRLRWIAKTGDVNDNLSTSLAVIQAILTFVFFGLIVIMAIKGEWRGCFTVYSTKALIDMCIFLPYFNRIKRMRSWLFIPIYEFVFPIYSLVILALMYVYKPEWKGRKLTTNY
jgi:glycosyltransferase involved in cell wall biosynthesis